MTMEESDCLWAEPPANHSALQDSERAWQIRAATWHLNFYDLLMDSAPIGWSGRMCPDACIATEEGILVPSSGQWLNSGTGGPTESLTLNTSEHNGFHMQCHSAEGVCSLSDVLEAQAVPQRFYLTERACTGILRRAEDRGRKLPKILLEALGNPLR